MLKPFAWLPSTARSLLRLMRLPYVGFEILVGSARTSDVEFSHLSLRSPCFVIIAALLQ